MTEAKNRTKSQLELALRTLLREKPLSQIRVRELTEMCGIRRQSFYYHFTDVYDLFAWSVEREGEALAARQEECLTWQQAFQDLLQHTSENRDYCLAVRDTLGRGGLQRMFGGAIGRLRHGGRPGAPRPERLSGRRASGSAGRLGLRRSGAVSGGADGPGGAVGPAEHPGSGVAEFPEMGGIIRFPDNRL